MNPVRTILSAICFKTIETEFTAKAHIAQALKSIQAGKKYRQIPGGARSRLL